MRPRTSGPLLRCLVDGPTRTVPPARSAQVARPEGIFTHVGEREGSFLSCLPRPPASSRGGLEGRSRRVGRGGGPGRGWRYETGVPRGVAQAFGSLLQSLFVMNQMRRHPCARLYPREEMPPNLAFQKRGRSVCRWQISTLRCLPSASSQDFLGNECKPRGRNACDYIGPTLYGFVLINQILL